MPARPPGPRTLGEDSRRARPREGEGGFVLGFVVMMLFAVAVAGAAGFQMVSAEFTLATQSRDGDKALVVARAGLSRFFGEQAGVVGDSVSYAIGEGIATVTTRKLFEEDSLNHMYYVRSEGSVADLRTPLNPARRVVGTYAWHRISPLPHVAAVVMTGGDLRIRNSGDVSGFDRATTGDCAAGGTAGIYGVATGGSVQTQGGATLEGNPGGEDESYADFQAVYDSVGLRWDVLSNPSFPVEFDGSPPNFSSLPADSFPLVRYVGDLTAHGWTGWSGGRGALIVTGRFTPGFGFSWNGIVLAGELRGTPTFYQPRIDGIVVGGLNGGQSNVNLRSGDFYYHSCNVYAANRALSYLEVLDNTVFEVN